jgi:hypothetical protein
VGCGFGVGWGFGGELNKQAAQLYHCGLHVSPPSRNSTAAAVQQRGWACAGGFLFDSKAMGLCCGCAVAGGSIGFGGLGAGEQEAQEWQQE